jgi:hypothetical protein
MIWRFLTQINTSRGSFLNVDVTQLLKSSEIVTRLKPVMRLRVTQMGHFYLISKARIPEIIKSQVSESRNLWIKWLLTLETQHGCLRVQR